VNDVFLDDIVRAGERESGQRRREARREAERRYKRRRRSAMVLVGVLAFLAGVGWGVVQFVIPDLGSLSFSMPEASDYPGPGAGTVEVVIPSGATGGDMGDVLLAADVVASREAFVEAFSANGESGGIQPGTYRLLLQMDAAGAVAALLNPENRVETRVTIPEGFRQTQVLERLASVTAIPVEQFEAAMADTAATGLPAEAGGAYEGWLFPATYTFEPDTTPTEMIAEMVAKTIAALDEQGVAAADRERILILASLAEREGRTSEDRAKIVRAILNRLDANMALDIDAALAYGLDKSGTALTNTDKETDTPYNLYMHTGLPPTPIASPGADAITATLNPAEGPWYFWVAVNLDTGETLFAETYAEHQQNVQKLREWQAQQESGSDG
jgi:UPF0755 protein